MKDYREVAQEILLRRDQYAAKRQRRVRQTAATITCFCIVGLLSFGAWRGGLLTPPVQIPDPENSTEASRLPSGETAAPPTGQGQVQELPRAVFNSVTADPAVYPEIALPLEDYIPLTYEELLDYYGVSLSVETLLPDSAFQVKAGQSWGIYCSGTRGIYYDMNRVMLEGEDGTTLEIAFSKAAHRPAAFFTPETPTLAFTEIQGRRLALLQYTDGGGMSCYHAELLQGEVAWYVTAVGMEEADFLRVLLTTVIPEDAPEGDGVQTVSGTVNTVDPGILGILEEGTSAGWQIRLPEGVTAEKFALGAQVTVSYTGEPVGIRTLWPQQLTHIE